MSKSGQNFGFDETNLAVIGTTIRLTFTIADLQEADVASAQWILADTAPGQGGDADDIRVEKTPSLTDSGNDLTVEVTLDPEDTEDLPAGDYYHALSFVHDDGSEHESARGTGRLTAAL